MKNIATFALVGILVLGGVLLFGSRQGPEEAAGVMLPDLTLKSFEGEEVVLRELVGTPLVVNSWAVWCPFCKAELEDFAKLQEEFGDEITVVAIDRQETLLKAKGFTDEIGVTERMTFLLDPKDAFYKGIGGFSMPETIFADAEGNIIVHKRGPMALDEMRQKVNSIAGKGLSSRNEVERGETLRSDE